MTGFRTESEPTPTRGPGLSTDFYDALDSEVVDLLADAARRADDNERKTVYATISESGRVTDLIRYRYILAFE